MIVGFFLIMSIYMSIIGFGTSTYSYGLGFMGYFTAANEISALYILICPLFIFMVKTSKYKKNIKIKEKEYSIKHEYSFSFILIKYVEYIYKNKLA